MARVVIIGASLAGTQAAQTMRRAGFEGDLVMIGDEPHLPYDRPPLSKNYLTDDEPDEEKLRLRAAADPEALGVDWRLGRSAVSLDPEAKTVTLDDGEELGYDGAIIATGASPRRLPGSDALAGVAELRTLDDARALRAALLDGPSRVAVCGAGFIGAEVAASVRQRGIDVTLIDAAPAPLDRVLDRSAGMAVADLHRSHGVDVRLGVGVERFEPASDDAARVGAVVLSDGLSVEADLVVVGIGVIPNTGWLDGSRLTVDNGIVVDETCLAAPGLVACGDVARWPNRRFGGRLMRIEQWDNAVDMGMYAGKRLLAELGHGDTTVEDLGVYEPVPWFWSDQYDRKIQLAGVTAERHEIVQGTIEEGRFVQAYADDHGLLIGALCWNRPRQAIVARQMIAGGETMEQARERLA